MDSIGAGATQLLLYDEMTGSTALLFWSIVLYLSAYMRSEAIHTWTSIKIFLAFVASVALLGPCGSAVCFAWARDEIVFSEPEKEDKKTN